MSSRNPESSELAEDFANSGEDQLLRELAAAPRPDARTLLGRALPELADTLEAEELGDTPRQGDVIDGRYRVEAVLGSGGMGVVYAATQLSTGRQVALKWMRSRGRSGRNSERDAAFLRFVREAQVAGRIRHPNVVDVYDAGIEPSAPYLVMEKLEGETLRKRMERGPMGWDEALAILLPAMRGVIAAHEKGVIHRDLKPDNVFLARDSAGNEVSKVLDFGISRLHGNEANAETSLTRTGATIGTPAYMPLEQLCGTGSDERTDVYALGVVLYEMLAGERPYVARNAADFAVVIASRAATPLSRHCPELGGVQEARVMRALEREAEQRYPSVQAFADALVAPTVSPGAGPSRSAWVTRAVLAAVGLACTAFLVAWCPSRELPSPESAKITKAKEVKVVPVVQAAPEPPGVVPLEAAPGQSVPETPSPRPARPPRRTTGARSPAPPAPVEPDTRAGLREADFAPVGLPAAPPAPRPGVGGAPDLELGRGEF